MTTGHALVTALLHAMALPSPAPPTGNVPPLPVGIKVPPARTGQLVAAAFAILLDLAGLGAVGIATLLARRRRRR